MAILATAGYLLDGVKNALARQGLAWHNPYAPHRREFNIPSDAVLAFLTRKNTWAHWKAWLAPLDLNRVFTNPEEARTIMENPDDNTPADRHLIPLLRPSAISPIEKRDIGWWADNLTPSGARLYEHAVRVVITRGVKALTEPGVIVSTIHGMKGGEADVVIVAPDLSPAATLEWENDPNVLHRVFYVAVTRAKEAVYIVSGKGYPLPEPSEVEHA